MTWYHPDEIKYRADNGKVQPEFPLLDVADVVPDDDLDELGTETGELADRQNAWVAKVQAALG